MDITTEKISISTDVSFQANKCFVGVNLLYLMFQQRAQNFGLKLVRNKIKSVRNKTYEIFCEYCITLGLFVEPRALSVPLL